MALIKARDAVKLSAEERNVKINELQFELVKSNVTAQKTKAKTKEIKRTLARLLTINSMIKKSQEVAKK